MPRVQHHAAVIAADLDPDGPPAAEAGFVWLPSQALAIAVIGSGKGEMGSYFGAEFEATTVLGGMVGLLADPGQACQAQHGDQPAFDAGRAASPQLGRAADGRAALQLLQDNLEQFWRSAHEELHRPPPPRSVRVGGSEYLVRDHPHVPFQAAAHRFRRVQVACLRFGEGELAFTQLGGFALYRWNMAGSPESLVPVGMLGHPSCPWTDGVDIPRDVSLVLQALSLPHEDTPRTRSKASEPLGARVPCAPGDTLLLLSSSTFTWMDPAALRPDARLDSVQAVVDRTTAALRAARGARGDAFVVAAFAGRGE